MENILSYSIFTHCNKCGNRECNCQMKVMIGDCEYIAGGWIQCAYDTNAATGNYKYTNNIICGFDIIEHIMKTSKKLSNNNLLKKAVLMVIPILKNYENLLLEQLKIKSSIFLPKITSLDLKEFANSDIQQIDPDTIEFIYNSLLHFLEKKQNIKYNSTSILITIYPEIPNIQVSNKDHKAIAKLEESMMPYIIQIEQAQIALIKLLNDIVESDK